MFAKIYLLLGSHTRNTGAAFVGLDQFIYVQVWNNDGLYILCKPTCLLFNLFDGAAISVFGIIVLL